MTRIPRYNIEAIGGNFHLDSVVIAEDCDGKFCYSQDVERLEKELDYLNSLVIDDTRPTQTVAALTRGRLR